MKVEVIDIKKDIFKYTLPSNPVREDAEEGFEGLKALTADCEYFYLIIDIAETNNPTAKVRHYYINKFGIIRTRLKHVAVIYGNNLLINVAAQFGVRMMGIKSFSFHKSEKEGLRKINTVINDL